MQNKIFDYNEIIEKREKIENDILAEYKKVRISILGGKENSALIVTVSLDKKNNWAYGILQNSRYYHFDIDRNGIVENFSGSYKVKKIRKKRVKSLKEAVEYINKNLQKQRGLKNE